MGDASWAKGIVMERTAESVAPNRTTDKETLTCEVCFEPCTDRLKLEKLQTGNGDVLRQADCGHRICRGCMALYVTVRVEENRVFGMRCPHEGCSNELFEQDLARLPLPNGVLEQFVKLRSQDYSQRAKELRATLLESCNALETARELCQFARLCPRCNVVLQKSQGCNSFFCICGHHFQYDKAPRVFPATFPKVIDMADKFNMTIEEAELRVGQGFCKASRVALQMGVSLEEARELQKRAQGGDEAARAQIAAARRKVH